MAGLNRRRFLMGCAAVSVVGWQGTTITIADIKRAVDMLQHNDREEYWALLHPDWEQELRLAWETTNRIGGNG